jgi:CRISPR-associated endonuclease/helicase Cas3
MLMPSLKVNKRETRKEFSAKYGSYLAAKTSKGTYGISVYLHCLASGHVAKKLLGPRFLSQGVRSWIEKEYPGVLEYLPFVIACHDVGKICAGFQAMIRKVPGLSPPPYDDTFGCLRHEVISYEATKGFLGEALAKILLYHHGSYRNGEYYPDHGQLLEGVGWAIAREATIKALAKAFNVDVLSIPKKISLPQSLWKYLAGLVVVSDWVASDESCFPADLNGYTAKDIPELAHKALMRYGFQLPMNSSIPDLSFQELFGFTPNPGQEVMAREIDGPGLYIYEAPMGIGKTEAALYPALDLYRKGVVDGVYFGMPTQVTSNRILQRMDEAIQRWFDDPSTKLLHGTADVFHNPSEDDWFRGNKRAVLDEFGAGTIDQALLGVLPNVKHFFIRTMGMCRKAVIIDEVHSYDMYTSGLVKSLIDEIVEMDGVVIVLTATLTDEAKRRLLL